MLDGRSKHETEVWLPLPTLTTPPRDSVSSEKLLSWSFPLPALLPQEPAGGTAHLGVITRPRVDGKHPPSHCVPGTFLQGPDRHRLR